MYGYYRNNDSAENDLYTDLALERRRADTSLEGVEYKKEIGIYGVWERIKITSEKGAQSIGKPKGVYDTLVLSRMDLLDEESIDDAKDEIARELCYLCDLEDVIPEKVLVVGLGNSMLTADSIGTRSAEKVKPTLHIRNRDEVFFNALECSEIAILLPGVAAKTGLDSFISVKGISDIIKPDVIFVIDALMTRAEERLGTTIQISTTGILPGSGLGNSGAELSQSTLGVPVIAIGVPTVINSRCFGRKEANLSCIKKSEMFVSPKEIGEIAEVAAEIIGGGINQAFGMTV